MTKNRKAELTSAVKRFYDHRPSRICFANAKEMREKNRTPSAACGRGGAYSINFSLLNI
jgi:hypothetical protein